MKIMSFPEILDCENGQQITALQGTLRKVYEQKTGVGDYGPWHLQNIILEDEHANELTITWCCEDVWTGNDIGKHLYFESGRDKKDQLAGIKREIKKKVKDGKTQTYESVKVDDRAKVKILNGGAGSPAMTDDRPGFNPDLPKAADPDWPEAPATVPESSVRPQNGNGKLKDYAKHAGHVFALAWEESKNTMALIPTKDAEDLSTFEWLDLRLRIAQNFAIEINKIIRKEKF